MSIEDKPPVDNPIKSSAEDVLGRAEVAHDFAGSLRRLDLSEGAVVGVMGAWGSGKSSFVNLMREEFERDPGLAVVDFNPWMFSGAQQLVDVFFKEIASELRLADRSRFGGIAEALDEYGDVLSPIAILPVVGGWFDRAHKSYKSARRWWKERGAKPLRQKVSDALAGLDRPVVVVVDDIDRLSTEEIRDIFKLVRLTASFPNVVYVLAFDRLRVERALDETNVPGRAYLEKIVQLSFDLPQIPRELLRRQILEKLNAVLDGVENLRFSQSEWSSVYFEIIEPLIGSLRDVTRLTLSARSTIEALGSEIEVVDILALEAFRVFRPELFQQVRDLRQTLTQEPKTYGNRDTKPQQAEIDSFINVAGDDADVVRALIHLVFPMARRYTDNTHYGSGFGAQAKRSHRLADINYLDLYLERMAPSGLVSFRRAEKAQTVLADRESLEKYLDSLQPEDLEDTISGLEVYEDGYPIEAVVPASIVLINRIKDIPDRDSRGVLDMMRPDLIVGRVVLRLMRRIENEADRETAVREILPELGSYSSQFQLLKTVGHMANAGHKLISKELADELEAQLLDRVSRNHSAVPAEEWDLLRVYWQTAQDLGEAYVPPDFADPDEIRSLIKSGRSVSTSQFLGSANVRTEERLWWDGLLRVFGSEESLSVAIDALRQADGDSPIVQLAEKYRDGWRPKDFE